MWVTIWGMPVTLARRLPTFEYGLTPIDRQRFASKPIKKPALGHPAESAGGKIIFDRLATEP